MHKMEHHKNDNKVQPKNNISTNQQARADLHPQNTSNQNTNVYIQTLQSKQQEHKTEAQLKTQIQPKNEKA